MPSLSTLLAELVRSFLRLGGIFATEVAARDPLAFVAFAVGALLTTATVAFVGWLALGAVLEAVGIPIGSPGRTPPPRDRSRS